ncbi:MULTISPECIES: sensor histidine kinase [Oceanobacillus]|uniref:histidine kinase n=1 Tax=Oceanobacillus indicireducens TaxID=1004261 RepID=A0A917XWE9_9BACI|nr:sensor histidine kinase [Oceanobacillus indicireducens]GGN54491.1 two-component sensor histidine kinase [Oceanobacillus indicireducens]
MKKFSHTNVTKFIVFVLMIACLTGAITSAINLVKMPYYNYSLVNKNYYQSYDYAEQSSSLVRDIADVLTIYKNEEHILKGETIDKSTWNNIEEELFYDYMDHVHSDFRNTETSATEEEQYEKFEQEYNEEITLGREQLIQRELREYHQLLQRLENRKAPLYYVTDGNQVYTNTTMKDKKQFEALPAYFIFEDYKIEAYPEEVQESDYLEWVTEPIEQLNQENTVVYLAYTEEFLNPAIEEWNKTSEEASQQLYQLILFISGFLFLFIYLALVIGRKSFQDKEIHFHFVDKMFTDINVIIVAAFILLFFVLAEFLYNVDQQMILLISIPIAIIVFVLILSLVKHIKNRTLFKHTLIFQIILIIVQWINNIYRSGKTGMKTVLIVVGYPILIALTFFMFPVTIGVAAWFAYKKVKEFQAIQDGVAEIKTGNLHHPIDVTSKGEFATLAKNINTITDGLKNAVNNELKSERLKTELITNVSHDIRTPLTSIITYVDLLKQTEDPIIAKGFVEILDQKSKRLKSLTDNLFDAAKASSGNVPVELEKIDVNSLITQGIGELTDKIEANNLQFKVNHPEDKIYVKADGRLLWRSIENLFSNIFNYALEGSRVYIDITDRDDKIQMTFKNISAAELNMTADELMERFKRGDESRSTEGSGLGLSIARSLIELQKGDFSIHIDGDLFKVIIKLPKYLEK